MRPKARGTAIIAFEKSCPCLGQAEKPERVTCRGRVEDDVIVARASSPSRPTNSSNAAISVVQAPDSCSRTVARSASVEPGAHLLQHAPTIVLGRGLRIDVHGEQTGRARNLAGASVSCVPSISSRFEAGSVLTSRTDRPDRQEQALRAGKRGLADAALAREEQIPGWLRQ